MRNSQPRDKESNIERIFCVCKYVPFVLKSLTHAAVSPFSVWYALMTDASEDMGFPREGPRSSSSPSVCRPVRCGVVWCGVVRCGVVCVNSIYSIFFTR
jgi:hypothetical protein